ncbi:hypothetical protein [Amycolatopsis anabasis]|uniref:hypothetical protein n=1 Tax=Amycolatopsis anabasis TaxID=1840409 RepID=UPI00131CD64A|nr:hypothetical protein [Amycolatopsis anabasis]
MSGVEELKAAVRAVAQALEQGPDDGAALAQQGLQQARASLAALMTGSANQNVDPAIAVIQEGIQMADALFSKIMDAKDVINAVADAV